MLEQILEYLKLHPIIGSIAIPIILGMLTSFISEAVKQMWFEDDPFTPRDKKVFRWITLWIALFLASLTLGVLWEWINNWFLRVLFVLLNTLVPFVFYHLKGRDLVTTVINKLMGKVENTQI